MLQIAVSAGQIRVVDVPEPALRSGGMLVRTSHSLISVGTESAGLSAGQGQPASRDAVDVLAAEGVELSKFRSQPVTENLLEKATHIFVMTDDHRRLLDLFFPEFIHKVCRW